MYKSSAVLLAGVVMAVCSASVYGQSVDLNERIKSLSELGKVDPEYRLGTGDLIEVSVFGVPDYRKTVRINAQGIIQLQLIDSVTAAGLTTAELEQKLAATLIAKDLIKDPQVSVFVTEYRSQTVNVFGAVLKPGPYQITMQLKIVDVIALAGGLQGNAVDEAVIQRKSPEGEEQVIRVNLTELLEKQNLALNVVIHGGDVIHVQARLVMNAYVVGEVNRPGVYELSSKQPLRLSQLYAYAGSATKTAKQSEGLLLRYDEKGVLERIPVNLNDVLKGKKEDFFVKANDIIFIPGSRIKAFSESLIIGTTAIIPYRILIP